MGKRKVRSTGRERTDKNRKREGERHIYGSKTKKEVLKSLGIDR